jgi:hypothetical protein
MHQTRRIRLLPILSMRARIWAFWKSIISFRGGGRNSSSLIPEVGRIFEDFPHGEPDRARVWSAEMGVLRLSSGTEIPVFFRAAEFFDLTV